MKLFIVTISLLLAVHAANAATFCVGGLGLPPQCIYEDVRDCYRAANAKDLTCVVNPDAYLTYLGDTRYCEVGVEKLAQCIFVDRSQCNNDASRRNYVCFDRQVMNDANNPYKLDPRVQY